MKTVTLFRHAKSGDKDNPAIAGYRPAARQARPESGAEDGHGDTRAQPQAGHDPLLAFGADAANADLAVPRRGTRSPRCTYDERVYEASAPDALKLLRELPDEVGHVMIVGHNPGLQELAIALTPAGTPGARRSRRSWQPPRW